MRTTAIGLVMLNDERKHVYEKNNPENMTVLKQWAEIISTNIKNLDGSSPEVVCGSEIITSILGSMAAACECELDGNIPIKPTDIMSKIDMVENLAEYNGN